MTILKINWLIDWIFIPNRSGPPNNMCHYHNGYDHYNSPNNNHYHGRSTTWPICHDHWRRFGLRHLQASLPDGYSKIFRSYAFGPSGFWTMAPLRYAANFDPFLSLDSARVEGGIKFCHLATMPQGMFLSYPWIPRNQCPSVWRICLHCQGTCQAMLEPHWDQVRNVYLQEPWFQLWCF